MEYVVCVDAEGSGGLLTRGALYVVALSGKGPVEGHHPGGGLREREGARCRSNGGFIVLSPFYTRGCRNVVTFPITWARDRFRPVEVKKRPPKWVNWCYLDTPAWEGEAP